jgi:hypothetical protein
VRLLTAAPTGQLFLRDLVEVVRRVGRPTNLHEKTVSTLSNYLPTVAATLDWLQPSKLSSWGGPMNGQLGRQQLIRELLKFANVDAVVETGTYRGTTTEFLWHLTGRPVYSVECERRFYEYARRRFCWNSHIHLSLADSRAYLRQLAQDHTVPKQNVLFYLDAHWGSHLPLQQELTTIVQEWQDPIIVIDDFEVPGDPGYGFDDYGDGLTLTLHHLPSEILAKMIVFSPSLPSVQETGARRGCAIAVGAGRASDFMATLPLRRIV